MKLQKILLIIAALIAITIAFVIIFKPFKQYEAPQNSIEITLREVEETQPSEPNQPYNLSVLNLSDSSFGIFFRTKEQTTSYLQIGQNKVLDQKILDYRDNQSDPAGKYYNHYFEFSDPAAITEDTYQFRIIVNKDKIYDNNGGLYEVELPPLLSSPPRVLSLEGYLSVPQDPTKNDILIVVQDGEGESTYVGNLLKDRAFIQSIGTMRNIEKTSYLSPTKLDITIFAEGTVYKTEEFLDFAPDNLYNLVVK